MNVPRIRVVIADDAHEMRMLVGLTLTLDGAFEVVAEADNGREAVERAREHAPDLVLLDLSMPEMDGLEALPRILEHVPAAVVFVFSGFEEAQLGAEARRLGAAGFIEKGVPLNEVARRLKEHFAQKEIAKP